MEIIGDGILTEDGHCTCSPDGRWLLIDTYPDRQQMRTLILYHLRNACRFDIGRFFAGGFSGELRCDLHPRWSRSGRQICFDSVHEGSRQMYVMDVGPIVASSDRMGRLIL